MLSEKQMAVKEFLEVSYPLSRIVEDDQSRGLLKFNEAFIQSVAHFGASELYAREAERARILGLSQSKSEYALERYKRYHEKGIQDVTYAKEALNQFREELNNYPTEVRLDENEIVEFMQDFNAGLADLEIKPSDAEKISKTVTESMEYLAREGASVLPDYLEEKIDELVNIRNQEDRGAADNIAVWKIVAISVVVGAWIFDLFRCRWWGSCNLKRGLSDSTVAWIAYLLAQFC